VSREKSSTAISTEKHPLQCVHPDPVVFGEPAMFWLDEVQLHEYLGFELERLSKSETRT
jgi:hypothetical protein